MSHRDNACKTWFEPFEHKQITNMWIIVMSLGFLICCVGFLLSLHTFKEQFKIWLFPDLSGFTDIILRAWMYVNSRYRKCNHICICWEGLNSHANLSWHNQVVYLFSGRSGGNSSFDPCKRIFQCLYKHVTLSVLWPGCEGVNAAEDWTQLWFTQTGRQFPHSSSNENQTVGCREGVGLWCEGDGDNWIL